jgi:hypothetical protein
LTHGHNTDELLKDIHRKQGPTKWPETLEASRSVDEFLWKGDPRATPVQRVGLAVFAVMYLFLFVVCVVLIVKLVVSHDWFNFVWVLGMASVVGIGGFRFLRNIFRREAHH